jgi:hypothetical protein
LIEQLKATRAAYARVSAVERALQEDGHVSAAALARMLKNKEPLTGELRLIAKFARTFPLVAGDVARTTQPISGTNSFSSAVLGGIGMAAVGDPSGLAMGGLPLLRNPVRNRLLSESYQRGLTEPPRLGPSVRGAMVGKTLFDYKDQVE